MYTNNTMKGGGCGAKNYCLMSSSYGKNKSSDPCGPLLCFMML